MRVIWRRSSSVMPKTSATLAAPPEVAMTCPFTTGAVPVTPGTESLAPDDAERLQIEQAQEALRKDIPGMVFLSFPGDEKYMGGCLAAGRGFFHINAHGDAEPCPFSPYSDVSLKNHTLLEAMQSPFFQMVRDLNAQDEGHMGGCALFEKEAQVKALLFP